MTTLAHRETPRGPAHGGVAARRALVHWAWRLFRREWRQQILVVTLLAVAVAAAIGSVTVASNSGADRSNEAEFGSADQLLSLDGGNPRALAATLRGLRQQYGTIDIIGHRSLASPVPSSRSSSVLVTRAGPYGGAPCNPPRQLPDGRDQVAVATASPTCSGSRSETQPRRPSPDRRRNRREPRRSERRGSPSSLRRPPGRRPRHRLGEKRRIAPDMAPGGRRQQSIRGNDNPADELLMFSVATVFLLLASLIAAAGFAVIAQRRLRQLGMLAAIGATEKHLRLVVMTNGAVVGAIGTDRNRRRSRTRLALVPTLETALIIASTGSASRDAAGSIVLLAIVGATAAAWWPGRAVARHAGHARPLGATAGRPPIARQSSQPR
jgi:putative ABC transport system permease protein